MRDETKDRSLLLKLRLQLGNSKQWLGGVAVQVEDDECRGFATVLLDLLRQLFDGLNEADLDTQLLCRLLDLAGEKEIIDEDVDALRSVCADLQWLHIGVGEVGGALLLVISVATLLLATAGGASEAAKATAATLVIAILGLS